VHGSAPPPPTPRAKGKGTDLAKSTKVSKTNAKSEAAVTAGKTKKPPATNSTADVGAKPTKSGKKASVPADAKAKASATVVSKEESAAEVKFEEDMVLTKHAEEGTDDLIFEFRDLPSRLQETLMPDLARLSQHSKSYLSAVNDGIVDGVRPILGGRWAAVAASAASVAVLLLLLPLFMLTALVRHMGPYLLLLHRALLLQAYLAIYFAMLALTAAATRLEPLRFVHVASPVAPTPGCRPRSHSTSWPTSCSRWWTSSSSSRALPPPRMTATGTPPRPSGSRR
jgi:hypothetical protein